MAFDFQIHHRRHRPRTPFVQTLLSVVGPTGRPLTCAAYEVQTGLELRLSYGDDVMRTELFRGIDRGERLAETADAWHSALMQKGFREVEP
jgi:hypothetical protein